MSRDFDSPWKETLEVFTAECLETFSADIFRDIDWRQEPESLDTELQKILRESELGRTVADKLFKVRRKNGDDLYLLIHIEVQSQVDRELPLRIFTYAYRIFDRYRLPLVSLVILGDSDQDWRPTEYRTNHYGCETLYRFRSVKLLDFLPREAELEASSNPLFFVILAHLQSLATKDQPEARYNSKWRLIRRMLEDNWSPEKIRQTYRLIDWLLELPKELEQQLQVRVSQLEKEKLMPFVTSPERFGIEKGERKVFLEAIQLLLEVRFSDPGRELFPEIQKIESVDKLRELHQTLGKIPTLEAFRALLP